MSQDETHDLEKLGAEWAAAVSADLSGLFGVETTASGPDLQHAERDALLSKSGVVVCSRCEVAEENAAQLWIVQPLRSALTFTAAKDGKSSDDLAALESGPFEGAVAEAYASAMDLCIGILGRVLDEEAGLPGIQLCESKAIDLPANDELIPKHTYRCARFEFEVAGFPTARLDVFFGEELATKWFGHMEQTAAESNSEGLGLRIVVIDPSSESRETFTDFAEELDAQIVGLDPSEVGPDSIEEFATASWIVLTWDLGGRSGLELLDELRGDAATRDLNVAIASPAPTHSMVEAALRWGARTFLYQPWDAQEIRERLTDVA